MRIIRKLKSKQGASAILGLLFFFICFFVASVVISAASVNISRARAQIEEQQAYLAISAADSLLRQEFAKAEKFTAKEYEIKHDCHICANEYNADVEGLKLQTIPDPDNPTAELIVQSSMKDIMESLGTCAFCTNTIADYSEAAWYPADSIDPADWSYDFDILSTNLKDVHVHMTTDPSYNIYAEMTVDSKFGAKFSSTLKIKAVLKRTEETATSTTNYCTHEVQHTLFPDGSMPKVESIATNFFNKVTTHTVEIKWDTFETVKGLLITGDITTTTEEP